VVWLNKPTFASGDDPEEIHYQNVGYKENHSNPKASIHPNLNSHIKKRIE
jgi:hypothetical protein